MLVFDGDCGFCTTSAGWVSSRWEGRATAVAWQQIGAADLGAMGLTPADCRDAAWWRDPSGRLARGHKAIGSALLVCGGWERQLGRAILSPLLNPVASLVYRLVARNRSRLPGGSPACALPSRDDASGAGS